MPRITLLTDFGTRDGYVGAMKGVIASIYPGVLIDDVSHDVPRGDPAAAGRALARYWRRYPAGTVHLAVVDPGVGTSQRALCVQADRRIVVAPDNGLVTPVLREATRWRAVELTNERYFLGEPSRTFHGRDVFAPVAAHVAQGIHPARLGAAVTDPIRLDEPEPEVGEDGAEGEVVAVDRFGNLITNLSGELLEEGGLAGVRIEIDGRRIPVAVSYGSVERGAALALVNSDNRIEVAIRDGSAHDRIGKGLGARVSVRRETA